MRLLSQGNEKAFREVYSRFGALVFGYSLRLAKDRNAAEDIAQEVWIRIVRLAASYRGDGSLRGWLLTITRNTALSQFRSRKPEIPSVATETFDPGQVDECERNLLRLVEVSRLVTLLHALPEAQRVALTLWISEKLSYEEIAVEMGLSESAVKSLIFRARRELESQCGGRS